MSRVAYVDGQYSPHHSAAVHIEDRGYQFADGVYEVMAVVGGSLVDQGPHLTRLARSLARITNSRTNVEHCIAHRHARGRWPQQRARWHRI